jgi:hypothetical protein
MAGMLELIILAAAFAFLAAVPTGIPAAAVLAAVVAAGRVEPVAAVVVCAIAAVAGRALLLAAVARGARVLPRSAAANLSYARELLGSTRIWWAAALLAVPLFPALQVMVVAASAGVRRLPLLVGYGAGRLLMYALAASAAGVGTAAVSRVTHPGVGRIALSLGLCALSLFLASRIDWRLLVERRLLAFVRPHATAVRS